jgi:hypothetical protein
MALVVNVTDVRAIAEWPFAIIVLYGHRLALANINTVRRVILLCV